MPIRYSSVAGGSSSDFTVAVNSSGNTTYELDKSYPSGLYSISTINQDTSYDIYVISDSGLLSGYTNGSVVNASESFSSIVVFGVSANDQIVFTYRGAVLTATVSGDSPAAAAFISSVTQSSLPSVDDSTTILGGNFADNVSVSFIDSSNAIVPAKNIVKVSNSSLIVTRPDVFTTSNSPYSIKVENPGIPSLTSVGIHTLSNSITAGTNPAWQTSASQVYNVNNPVNITLTASDAENSDIDYSLVSGTLPVGLSLDTETGAISGTPTTQAAGAANVFTIRATDAGGNSLDRQFTFTANTDPVWVTASSVTATSGSLPTTGYQLQATPSLAGSTISYSIVSGSLQPGLSLNSSGKISGTPAANAPAQTITFRATDQYGLYVEKTITFNITYSVYLFNNGDQNSAVTGGWSQLYSTGGSSSITSTSIDMSAASINGYDVAVATNNAIDLTSFSTLEIYWTTTDVPYHADFGLISQRISLRSQTPVVNLARDRSGGAGQTGFQRQTIDVSSYNGSYYIFIGTYGAENLSWNGYIAGGNTSTTEVILK